MAFASSLAKTMLLASILTTTAVRAHMKLSYPPPLRGETNPDYDWSSYDYSMTSPLSVDGSNFPCKGYQSDVPSVAHAQATLKAGQPFTTTFASSGATHGGGSCQFSLSYDGGENFGVIHSVIGGCPLQTSYTFTVPAVVPAGKDVLYAWTWMNKVGNREFYMNCAAVDVESSTIASLKVPRIFEANLFGAGTCNTVEGDEIVFPNPGDSVEYGGKWSSSKPGKDALQLSNCGGDILAAESSFVTFKSNTGASPDSGSDGPISSKASASSPAQPKPSTAETTVPASAASSRPVSLALGRTSAPVTTTRIATGADRSSAASADAEASPSATPKPSLALSRSRKPASSAPNPAIRVVSTPAVAVGACVESSMLCASDAKSFSVCSDGAWVRMGDVAAGTMCKDGAIVLADDTSSTSLAKSSCSPNQMKCSSDGSTFSICNAEGTAYTDMGPVAPGTKCQNGAIMLARKSKRDRSQHHAKRLGWIH